MITCPPATRSTCIVPKHYTFHSAFHYSKAPSPDMSTARPLHPTTNSLRMRLPQMRRVGVHGCPRHCGEGPTANIEHVTSLCLSHSCLSVSIGPTCPHPVIHSSMNHILHQRRNTPGSCCRCIHQVHRCIHSQCTIPLKSICAPLQLMHDP